MTVVVPQLPPRYASDLELRALCRLHDVKAVVVPQLPQLPVAAYHHKQKKHVLAIYYSNNHFDLLLPDKTDRYPEDLLQVTLDPEYHFWVGGVPRAASVFTASDADEVVCAPPVTLPEIRQASHAPSVFTTPDTADVAQHRPAIASATVQLSASDPAVGR